MLFAIGLSEVTDAVTVIVSEETGDISVVKGDKMNRALDRNEFRKILEEYLFVEEENSKDIFQVIRDFLNDGLQRGDK